MGKAVASPSSHPLPHEHAIRAKLLNRLGIYKTIPLRNAGERRKYVIRSVGATSQQLRRANVVPFRLPLNDSTDSTNAPAHQPLTFSPPAYVSPPSNVSLSQTNDRSIQFENEVLVVPIPSRHEYSNRIKKFLWTGTEEISENAERNRTEFASEGWDWHSVLEDDEMYVDSESGELVHPIWLEEEDEADEAMMMDGLEESLPKLSRSQSFSANLQELSDGNMQDKGSYDVLLLGA